MIIKIEDYIGQWIHASGKLYEVTLNGRSPEGYPDLRFSTFDEFHPEFGTDDKLLDCLISWTSHRTPDFLNDIIHADDIRAFFPDGTPAFQKRFSRKVPNPISPKEGEVWMHCSGLKVEIGAVIPMRYTDLICVDMGPLNGGKLCLPKEHFMRVIESGVRLFSKVQNRPNPQPGEMWQSHTGKIYDIHHISTQADAGVECVVFGSVEFKKIFTRDLGIFMELLQFPNGTVAPRYRKVD